MKQKESLLTILLKNEDKNIHVYLGYNLIESGVSKKWKNLIKFKTSTKEPAIEELKIQADKKTKIIQFKGDEKKREYYTINLDVEENSDSPLKFGEIYLKLKRTEHKNKYYASSEFILNFSKLFKFYSLDNSDDYRLVSIGKLKYFDGEDVSRIDLGESNIEVILTCNEIKNILLSPLDCIDDNIKEYSQNTWKEFNEIDYHLDLVPYIDLKIDFNFSECLQEAISLSNLFVEHRSEHQSHKNAPKWKSLGIKSLNGNFRLTDEYKLSHSTQDSSYQLTEVAEKCPNTLKFLSELADLDQCERVRFMLLEPGARVKVHSDAKEHAVSAAVNIALNMPSGCEFIIDTNSDGSNHTYTKNVPFRAGSAMLINVAKYHYVVNDSDQPRFHIILHGPLRMSEGRILGLARDQNRIETKKELISRLIKKYAELGMSYESMPFIKEWETLGLTKESLPNFISLIVLDNDQISDSNLRDECLKITIASLFPLKYNIIKASELDSWLDQRKKEIEREFPVIIASGTLITNLNRFILELINSISFMRKENAMICGHIMHWHKSEIDGPYFHEQFLIIDIYKYRQISSPSLGPYYGPDFIEFPSYDLSLECVHDDYTPFWVGPGSEQEQRLVRSWFGTNTIKASLEHGMKVINVPIGLRKYKMYSYPQASDGVELKKVRTFINEILDHSRRNIFFFNNEALDIQLHENFQPDTLLSVASGIKPAKLLNQYWQDRPSETIVFLDCSEVALSYIGGMSEVNSENDLIQYISKTMVNLDLGATKTMEFVECMLRGQVKDSFESNFSDLITRLNEYKNARYINTDLITNHQTILDLIDSNKKTLFWHSNVWYYRSTFFKYSESELQKNYITLIELIAKKLNMRVWKHRDAYQSIIGNNFREPWVILTDGCMRGPFGPESDYIQLDSLR
jgi:hypothetical protein